MTDAEIKRVILLDEPSNEDLFHGKGHERTADALVSAIKAFKNADRAIGLDGPWGSGKSSVVGIAERKLQQTKGNGKTRYHFFTFDIWKSQGSAFRRSVLEHFVAWAKKEFPRKSQQLNEIESKIKGKVREVDTNNQLNLDLYGIAVLLAVPFLPVYVLWTKSVYDTMVVAKTESAFLYSWPMFLIYAFLAATFLAAYAKYHMQNFAGKGKLSRFRLALSQTLLIGAKQYEHQKVTQYIRETDPNDFEFQSVLREILAAVQDERSKVIIVLDNIDRLPPDEIGDYWALVRSIFSRTHSDSVGAQHSQITAIVPYDRKHIEVVANKEAGEKNGLTLLRRRELFSKTFDEILNVAPPVMSNTREFFDQKIRSALPDVDNADALFRVYLIFNMLTDRDGGKATPRQVISYINEVSGLYSLHRGRIPLPTIATYLALQDNLDEQPLSLAQSGTIDDHLRSLAADETLEKNLAAILFNVEPELAFQLLLDGEIETAASAETSDALIALSQAHGFGVRVNDVFVANTSAWRSSGKFALVISNLTDLMKVYNGEALAHLKQSSVSALLNTPEIALDREADLLQKLLTVCFEYDRRAVLEHLFTAATQGLPTDKLDQSKGKAFLKFLNDVLVTVAAVDGQMHTASSLKKVVLPSHPQFLFGLATDAFSSPIKMSSLAKTSLDLTSDPTFLEAVAVEQPLDCIPAFASFKNAGIVTDDQWHATSIAIAKSLVDENTEQDDFQKQLPVLSATRSYTTFIKIKNADLADMLANADFYKRLHTAYVADPTSLNIAHGIFLAADTFMASQLSQPLRLMPTGQRVPDSEIEFAWFNQFLSGEIPLTTEQLNVLVDRLLAHHRVNKWTQFGTKNPENTLVSKVTGNAFSRSTVPWIGTAELLSQYSYIKRALGGEFRRALPAMGSRIRTDDVEKITVESYPSDIIEDTAEYETTTWKTLHDRAEALLNQVGTDDWLEHLTSGDKHRDLLFDKIRATGFSPTSNALKDAYLGYVLGTLNGTIQGTPAGDYDTIMAAIDQGYHLEFYRTVREGLKSTTVGSLEEAVRLIPETLRDAIKLGERTKQEKENLIRFLLRPSLEGNVIAVVDAFLALKRSAVSDFLRASDESVRNSMEPALRLFSTAQRGNYDYVRRVSELVQGKKSKSFFETWLGLGSDEDKAEE